MIMKTILSEKMSSKRILFWNVILLVPFSVPKPIIDMTLTLKTLFVKTPSRIPAVLTENLHYIFKYSVNVSYKPDDF